MNTQTVVNEITDSSCDNTEVIHWDNPPIMSLQIYPKDRIPGAAPLVLIAHGDRGYRVPFHPIMIEMLASLIGTEDWDFIQENL